MNDIFECEVIKILDHKNILISYGRANGASSKDSVRVIEKGETIEYKGEDYGSLDNIKAELYIKEIYERFSLCQSVKKTSNITNEFSKSILSLYNYQSANLNVNEEQIENIEIPDDKTISLGDTVEVIKF